MSVEVRDDERRASPVYLEDFLFCQRTSNILFIELLCFRNQILDSPNSMSGRLFPADDLASSLEETTTKGNEALMSLTALM